MQFAPGERCSSAAASITCSNNDSLQARLAFRVPQEALSRACALQDFENSDHLDGIQNTRLMD